MAVLEQLACICLLLTFPYANGPRYECRYCQRLTKPTFWGGEVELLVLSRMLHTPIYVYKTAQEGGR